MRSFPKVRELGRMRDQRSVKLAIASYAFMEQCAARLSSLNLTLSRSLALAYIDAHPGCDQASLGKAMGMNRGSTMQLVDNLERSGFASREAGSDRRSNALRLTRAGAKAFEQALKIDATILDTVFSGVSDREWKVVAKVVDSILEAGAEAEGTEAEAAK